MRNSLDYSEKKPMPEFKLRYHQQAVVDACRDILVGGEITEIVLSVTPGRWKELRSRDSRREPYPENRGQNLLGCSEERA